MIRYVFRRLLQTIPTLLGVILINFVLFNVVAESPALLVLGNKATAESLEEFDEVRGFNKPLLWGRRCSTRAYESIPFAEGMGGWKSVSGAEYDAQEDCLTLKPGGEISPLAFALRPQAQYEWKMVYRTSPDAQVQFFGTELASENWCMERLPVVGGAGEHIEVRAGELQIRSLELFRVVEHPWDSQLVFYFNQLLRGDLGYSEWLKQPVSELLVAGIGPSLSLMLPIFFIGLVVSISVALVCAFFRDTVLDRSLVIFSVALMSINYLVYIVVGQYGLAHKAGLFPVWGFESARYLLLPVLIGVVCGLGANIRFYRTVLLDEMHKDYVRTAFAKGVSRGRVLFVHVLRNAMIPVITNVATTIPFLFTGSLLLESFFGIPGLGYLGINAINSSDVDVVRALVLIGTILFMISNLVADVCYTLVDPRVKLR